MADIEETTNEVFGTRNVKNKEIYDSYMGILRISPNEIYGTDIDDPTELLNSLHNIEKGERTEIILSDSDGNVFDNIYFQPKAFQQNVISRDPKTQIEKNDIQDVINISTIVKTAVYVSNNMKSRSTILLVRPEEDNEEDRNKKIRHSNLRILSGGAADSIDKNINGDGWLLYPTESPNDNKYFNDKNKFNLFDSTITNKTRQEQVEQSLYEKTKNFHENNIDKTQRVVIGKKLLTNINQYNEDVPVYYTRDYILGHYEGHSAKTDNDKYNHFDNWGINGLNNEGNTDYITKLSWTRIDDLIWKSVEEIVTGEVRHYYGRYDGLGVNESADPGLKEQLGFVEGETYKKFAPILGTEMARGTIMYHSMPFHRYWFHRTRQVLRSLIERKKISVTNIIEEFEQQIDSDSGYKSLDDYIISKQGLSIGNSNFEKDSTDVDSTDNTTNNLFYEELTKVQNYYKKGILTPCPSGTVGFASSLGKNFAICNGRHLKFANFPNISPNNEVIFYTKNEDGIIGGVAKYDKENGSFMENTLKGKNDDTNDAKYPENSAFHALANSSGSDTFVKLPNLFALFEKTPRFIRGLNWKNPSWETKNSNEKNQSQKNEDIDDIVKIFDVDNQKTTYIKKPNSTDSTDDETENTTPMSYDVVEKDTTKKQYAMVKKITTTNKIYFHTYDHLIEKEKHQHNMFSAIEGGSDIEPLPSGKRNYNPFLGYYFCHGTNGGNRKFRFMRQYSSHLTWDRTYSKSYVFHKPKQYNFVNYTGYNWNDAAHLTDDEKKYVSNNWLKYCLEGDVYSENEKDENGKYIGNRYFRNFTPIPNIGLWLFNSSYFNNKGEINKNDEQRGSLPIISKTIDETITKSQNNYKVYQYTGDNGTIPPIIFKNKTDEKWYSYDSSNGFVKITETSDVTVQDDYDDYDVYQYNDELIFKKDGKWYSCSYDSTKKKLIFKLQHAFHYVDAEGKKHYCSDALFSTMLPIPQNNYEVYQYNGNIDGIPSIIFKNKTDNKWYSYDSSNGFVKITNTTVGSNVTAHDDYDVYQYNNEIIFKNETEGKWYSYDSSSNKFSEITLYSDVKQINIDGYDVYYNGSIDGIPQFIFKKDNEWYSYDSSNGFVVVTVNSNVTLIDITGYDVYHYYGGDKTIPSIIFKNKTDEKWYSYDSSSKKFIEKTIDSYEDSLIKQRDLEKERMKFFAQKLNEAEGFIPISWFGKATGYTRIGWSRAERSGFSAKTRNTYTDKKYNLAGYKLAAPNEIENPHDEEESEKYRWRCWSSIPYLNSTKLGVGDTKNYVENIQNYDEYSNYYDINSVTQLPSKDKYRNYYYGGEKINVDESCPTPPYMNFLPLIRI